MAKKYESEIDPDEFIRSFREESSSLSTLKKKPKAEGQTQESEPETAKVPSSKSVSESQPNDAAKRRALENAYTQVGIEVEEKKWEKDDKLRAFLKALC